mgnify:CR=1 FL=1
MAITHQIAYAERKKKAAAQPAPSGDKGKLPPKSPLSVAAAAREPGGDMTFLVKAPKTLVAKLEVERARRGLRSRNDAVVAVLAEALK